MTDLFIKVSTAIFAFIGFCYLCAFIRWQMTMTDFLLSQVK